MLLSPYMAVSLANALRFIGCEDTKKEANRDGSASYSVLICRD
jgi:hypothetical protein